MNVEEGESSRSAIPRQLEGREPIDTKKQLNHFSNSMVMVEDRLFEAARLGQWEFLLEAFGSSGSQPEKYLLSQKQDEGSCNIIHIAAKELGSGHDQDSKLIRFMEVALEYLPPEVAISLLCAKEEIDHHTPLHYAALGGSLPAVKLLTGAHLNQPQKPWLLKGRFDNTPLHLVFKDTQIPDQREDCALYLLSLDINHLCSSNNDFGETPLSLAIKWGFERVALKILESSCQYKLHGPNGFSILHLLSNRSVEVCRLLLKKHPELLRDKNNHRRWSVLHKWAEADGFMLLQVLLELENNQLLTEMIHSVDFRGATALHVAFMHHKLLFAQHLCHVYKKLRKEPEILAESCSLWPMQDDNGNTPLHLALTNELGHEEFFLEIMAEDHSTLRICNNAGESPLFVAVQNGHEEVVFQILNCLPYPDLIGLPLRKDGTTVLHVMFSCGDKTGDLLVDKFWWLINSLDSNGKTPLQVAEQADVLWAKQMLSRRANNPDPVNENMFEYWITASERGHSAALISFISHSPSFLRICQQRKDTPLHHLKLKSFKEYQDFIMNPSIADMKNMRDHDGATPLHRALEREDILLVEALLTIDGVDSSLPHTSDLLIKLCKEQPEWREMCDRAKTNPWVRPNYVKRKETNIAEMRQTLSVVAALLATLTFAAGFTIPGGFNSRSGEAILAAKAIFLIFILADTIAMCSSLLALFFLIWSMVCEIPDVSLMLVDQSVVILMVALYGTLLAFMTGVFTVIYSKSLWAAILICILCVLVGISATKTVLFKVLNKLIPTLKREQGDRIRLLEQGKAFCCCGVASPKAD